MRSNERGQKSNLPRGRRGAVLGERWMRGQEEGSGVNLSVALQRRSRADASTVGWWVRHEGEERGAG